VRPDGFFKQDCLRELMLQDLEKIDKGLLACGIKPLIPSEYSILKEYVLVMNPVCIALDTLQGEHNCFLRLVLPVLVHLKRSLNSLILTQFEDFRTSLLHRMEVRFSISLETMILFSLLLPTQNLNLVG